MSNDSNEILDVAVVGGGVSGVYSAWRLLTDGGMKNVTVFEADDHIGGRLLSVTPPRIPDMVAELGGMRILPAVQPRIAKLIETLNGKSDNQNDFIETYPFPVDQPQNISYLRGIHLRLQDFNVNPPNFPFHLTFQERGKTPAALVINAIEQILPGITNSNCTEEKRREMARNAVFDNEPLYKQGFWQVLMRVMSGEAYQLALMAMGYVTTLSNWNAADAIPWFLSDFGVNPNYRGFVKGFQQVPLTIQKQVEEAGGVIRLNTRIAGFEFNNESIELKIVGGEIVRAKALILAMPRRALDLITPQSPLLQETSARALIQSVTPRPLFKIFTTYTSPWWTAAGVQAGRSTTDLPVRQTYYWAKMDGSPATEGRAMLMASYDDGHNIGFWDGFRPKRGGFFRPDTKAQTSLEYFRGTTETAEAEYSEWNKYKAPAMMVAELQRQLADIHGLQFTPDVVDSSFKDWGDDPFGGGWNSWNIGVKSWEVKEQVINPAPGAPVYICGEAYSDAQGWVEGALQTADMMLEKYFDIKPL